MRPLLSGEFTLKDGKLYHYMRDLLKTEEIFLEPSACAAFQGPILIQNSPEGAAYIRKEHLEDKMANAAHIVWATGGSLVPEEIHTQRISGDVFGRSLENLTACVS